MLMVGYTFECNSAVLAVRDYLRQGLLGATLASQPGRARGGTLGTASNGGGGMKRYSLVDLAALKFVAA